ncbi:hypothetical protein BGY98DRAFT_277503 [Russula aff. rugulosa BPL654]|nr:hypothetical protein BGY98DRAFT_277503 [Russula aff. rugulosa BPL654]
MCHAWRVIPCLTLRRPRAVYLSLSTTPSWSKNHSRLKPGCPYAHQAHALCYAARNRASRPGYELCAGCLTRLACAFCTLPLYHEPFWHPLR